MRKILMLFTFTALLVTLPAGAAGRFRGGLGAGPAFGPWWGYGYSPFYYAPYSTLPMNAGEVKLDTNLKDAEVFIDGAYAGTAGKLKSMWLRSGAYNLELRSPGHMRYAERIYVVSGKTLKVHPDLPVAP
jgi:hypothetical protein